MKTCPNCHAQLNDDTVFCPNCGTSVSGSQPGSQYYAEGPQNAGQYTAPGTQANAQYQNTGYQQPFYAPPAPVINPYDHTSEFNSQDISDNKVISMLVYLLGPIGVIIALLASHDSKYAAFHVRQGLKFTVVEILTGIITALLFWTVIIPIAAGIVAVILLVLKIICFFQICRGKAIEPAIIRNLSFLK